MTPETPNPVAGGNGVGVIEQLSQAVGTPTNIESLRDFQARRLSRRHLIPFSLALAVADLAFTSNPGRPA